MNHIWFERALGANTAARLDLFILTNSSRRQEGGLDYFKISPHLHAPSTLYHRARARVCVHRARVCVHKVVHNVCARICLHLHIVCKCRSSAVPGVIVADGGG